MKASDLLSGFGNEGVEYIFGIPVRKIGSA